MLVFRVGDFTHPQVWEVAESEGVADECRKRNKNEEEDSRTKLRAGVRQTDASKMRS
jgi:hypothetical protein